MEYGFGTEGYYKKMLELQDKLRKSEEERLILEEKFNEMMQLTRDAEHDRLRLMRHRYHKFIEEDKTRQERNEQILQTLDKIEGRARMLAAKTQRFKTFRKQYEAYIKRIYRMKPEQLTSQNFVPSERMFARKKLFADLPENTETVEGKLAMLEQYLRDNFDNFPPDFAEKSPINNNRLFEDQNLPRNGYYENSFDKLEPESEESEYNKYPRKKYEKPDIHKLLSPNKNELLGNTIEKELERLQNKEPVKQLQRDNSIESKSPERVIQDYKEIVSKSEEKFGLRGESPVRKVSPKENAPNIFDNSTKLLNIEELKNITENNVQNITPIQQENVESEYENPVIKNYKQMLKSLNDDVSPNENNLKINDTHLQDNITFEQSKQEDISDRTEAPEDISLNLSTEPLPIEQLDEKKPLNIIKSVDNEVSIDESTIKEQLVGNLENEQKLPKVENSEEFKINSNQNNPTEISEQSTNENQNYIENYPQETLENQHLYQEYDTSQQNITEGFEQQYAPEYDVQQQQEYVQNQPEYHESYDNNVEKQPVYPEGYDQPNIPDPSYLESFDVTQQDQQSFPEGFDQNQSEYQQGYDQTQQGYDQNQQEYDQNQQGYDQTQPGYDPQYYPDQQNISDQVYDQQYTADQQPVYEEGYDQQYDPSQYVADEQYPQPQDQQYVADQQYQEYPDQQYQPEQYDQQYSEEQIQENVYSTEQEYIEGEQNIDKQYESEQNVTYEPEQYTENLTGQQMVEGGEQPNLNSESTELSVTPNEVDNKPIVEKKLPNLANMLDTDTESIKQDTKVSNESDFDFSKS